MENIFAESFKLIMDFYYSLPEWAQLDILLEFFVWFSFPLVRGFWRIISTLDYSEEKEKK